MIPVNKSDSKTQKVSSACEASMLDQKGCFHGFDIEKTPGISMFELGDEIGSGAFGNVFKARCVKYCSCDLAVKTVQMLDSEKTFKAKNELEMLEKLKDIPNNCVVTFFGYFDIGPVRYMVFELGQMNLFQFLKNSKSKFTIPQFNELLYQLLNIVNFLEKKI